MLVGIGSLVLGVMGASTQAEAGVKISFNVGGPSCYYPPVYAPVYPVYSHYSAPTVIYRPAPVYAPVHEPVYYSRPVYASRPHYNHPRHYYTQPVRSYGCR
jgi:hypothetical protein